MELIVTRDLALADEAFEQPEREKARACRQEAFEAETDPMAFEVLRGEVPMETYQARVAEIRARFPYPKE